MPEVTAPPSARVSFAEFSNRFSANTLMMNDIFMQARIVDLQLVANQEEIAKVYPKITMGGLVASQGRLIECRLEVLAQSMAQCSGFIARECSEQTQLTAEQWADPGTAPWLRQVFEHAERLSGMPDESSLAQLPALERVLVVRDSTVMPYSGLVPQVAALMPVGFTVEDVRIWWPWVMSNVTAVPVVLVPTEHPNVLKEVTYLALFEKSADAA